jgi:hypothetical protein
MVAADVEDEAVPVWCTRASGHDRLSHSTACGGCVGVKAGLVRIGSPTTELGGLIR